MGVEASKSISFQNESDKALNAFLQSPSNFQSISDNHFGEIYLPDDNSSFFLKQQVFQDSIAFERAEARLKQKAENLTHPRLMRILKVQSFKQSLYCTKVYRLAFLFEYLKRDLCSMIRSKRVQNKVFSNEELLKFIRDAVGALAFLQAKGIALGGLRSSTIFTDNEGNYRFLDLETFNLQNNISYFTRSIDNFKENYNSAMTSGVYLSPEQLDMLKKRELKRDVNKFKTDVFVLGMVVLEMVNLKALDNVYEYQNFNLKAKPLKEFISTNLKGKLRGEVLSFVEKCLIFDPAKRPDFIELEELISDGINRGISLVPKEKNNKVISHGNNKENENSERIPYQEGNVERRKSMVPNKEQNLSYGEEKKERRKTMFSGNLEAPDIIKHLHSSFNLVCEPEKTPKFEQGPNNFLLNPSSQPMIAAPEDINRCVIKPPVIKPIIYDNINDQPIVMEKSSSNQPKFETQNILIPNKPLKENPYNAILQTISTKNIEETPYNPFLNTIETLNISSTRQIESSYCSPPNPSEMQMKQQISEKTIGNNQTPLKERQNTINMPTPAPEKSVETYGDRSFYSGEFLGGLRHGKGFFQYSDGGTYEGNWRNGQMDGYGVLYYPNRQKAYEGLWIKDRFHGKGTIYNENSEINVKIEVNFKDFGTIGEDWVQYSGSFENDCKHGRGSIEFRDGSRFEGEFDRDRIDGQGVFINREGRRFAGEWLNNRLIRLF